MWITFNCWKKQGNGFFPRVSKNGNCTDKITLIQWESFDKYPFHDTMHLCYYFSRQDLAKKPVLASNMWFFCLCLASAGVTVFSIIPN